MRSWASIPQKDPKLFEKAETPEEQPAEAREAFEADLKLGQRYYGGEAYENSRSAEEKAMFKRALSQTMDVWYSHRVGAADGEPDCALMADRIAL